MHADCYQAATTSPFGDHTELREEFSGGNWETLEVEGYVPGPKENMDFAADHAAIGHAGLGSDPRLAGAVCGPDGGAPLAVELNFP
jgi:hypothetical protein